MNKSITQYQSDASACYEACLAANLDPATLAADPECIKRVVEAAILARDMLESGPSSAELTKRLCDIVEKALRAIGKGEA